MYRSLVLIILLGSTPCGAADSEPVVARERAPAIAAARARVLQAEERRHGTTLVPDPVFTAGFGRGEPRDGGASRSESSFEISQSLPALWGLRSRKAAGEAAIEEATWRVEATALDVLLQAKTLYYEAVLGAARADALSRAADDARSLSDLVARRVEVGEAPGANHLRTTVEALRAGAEARAAAAQAEGARAALNRFLLGALGSDFVLSTELDPAALAPLPSAGVEQAVSSSPALRAAQAKVAAATSAVDVERAARVPTFEVSAFSLRELDRKSFGATFGIAIPLWNRNQPGLGNAHAQLAEAQADLSALRSGIEADLERLFRRDRAAREVAVGYSAEILPAAREMLAVVRNSLEQGEADLLVWLEARRSYLETLRAASEAQLDAFVTRAEVERLIGDTHASN
jgi:cobalt-zinc-cadmium efflux system outer membrane protein